MLALSYGLLLPLVFSIVHALNCDLRTHYKWNVNEQPICCNKCKPGYHMKERCIEDSATKCERCGPDYYNNINNIEMTCTRCSQCSKPYMMTKRKCSNINDAECGCIQGYECKNKQCESCVKVRTSSPPPPATTTTKQARHITTKANELQNAPVTDSVWISLSLSCACVCILLTCFILVSRRTPAYGWIMLASSGCFWHRKKGSTQSSEHTEEAEEEVPMPVQEVAGKTEWQV